MGRCRDRRGGGSAMWRREQATRAHDAQGDTADQRTTKQKLTRIYRASLKYGDARAGQTEFVTDHHIFALIHKIIYIIFHVNPTSHRLTSSSKACFRSMSVSTRWRAARGTARFFR